MNKTKIEKVNLVSLLTLFLFESNAFAQRATWLFKGNVLAGTGDVMKRQRFKSFIVIWMVVFGILQSSEAQTQISRQVISNGSVAASNVSYNLSGTVGQPAIGPTNSSEQAITSGFWALDAVTVTSLDRTENNLPKTYRLHQNYPNPFNPTTTIQFAVAKRSYVSLKLFDMQGRKVATLVDEVMKPGEYKLQFEASDLPSGVYFYVMRSDYFSAARKLTLLK